MRINRIAVASAAVLAVTAGTPAVAAARAPELTLTTTASPAAAAPGARVTFTVTVENTGTVDYDLDPDSLRAWFADDLTEVLDDADYNGDVKASAGEVAFARIGGVPYIRWRGPLKQGAKATVTFSVTVPTAPRGGDGTLVARVSSTTPANNCHLEQPVPDDLGPVTRLAARLAATCDTTVPIR